MNRFKCPACGGNQYTACSTAEGCIYCGNKELKKMEILEPKEGEGMREIKFRGKRLDNGEWVYGYYFIEERDIEDGIIWRDIPQIQQRYGDHFQYFDVDPATIGQYTGLKDKNGTEIFEGDIVKDCDTGTIKTVLWHKSCFVLRDTKGFYQWTYYENEHEVIGNIHDNPELLGG